MKTMPDALSITAFHEAGHIVAYHFLGLKPQSVTIAATDDALGSARHHGGMQLLRLDGEVTPARWDRANRRIISLLAGAIAEEHFVGDGYVAQGTGSDYAKAAELALYLTGSEAEVNAYLAWLDIRTKGLIRRRWPIVEAVAKELLERKSLNRAEILATIISKMEALVSRRGASRSLEA